MKLNQTPDFFYEPYQCVRIKTDIENVDTKCDSLNKELTALIQQSKELLEKDFKLINQIYNSLEEFQSGLKNYKAVIQSKDNREIIDYFYRLDSTYSSIQNMIRYKQKNLSQFNHTITQSLTYTHETISELENGMNMVRNYYKRSKNDSLAQYLFEELKTNIESNYKTSVDLTNLSLAINSSQSDYHKNFNSQINAIRKTSKAIHAFLANHLKFSILKQERILKREIALSKPIENISRAGLKNLKLKLEKLEKPTNIH